MIGHRGTVGVFAILFSTNTGSAAIIPSWRINPISAQAVADSGGVLANAISVSLVVELTGGSLFNVAGLFLDDGAQGPLRGAVYYQNLLGFETAPPQFSVDQSLAFDTYIDNRSQGQPPPLPPGSFVGNHNLQVLFPPNSAQGERFSVAWGATPNDNRTELARLTFLNATIGNTPIPLEFGLVSDSLNPNTNVALPPIPVVVPEPTIGTVATVGWTLIAARRRSRRAA